MASTGEGVQTTETSFPREQLRVRIEESVDLVRPMRLGSGGCRDFFMLIYGRKTKH